MDTSIINELPPGRQPVKTVVANSFSEIMPMLEQTIEAGRQIYLVCPLIELSDTKTGHPVFGVKLNKRTVDISGVYSLFVQVLWHDFAETVILLVLTVLTVIR